LFIQIIFSVNGMPIIRKLIPLGGSKVVAIPKSWLRFFEKEFGRKIDYVAIEVNKELRILPYISGEEGHRTADNESLTR